MNPTRFPGLVGVMLLCAAPLLAQGAPSSRPKFDVASVKPNKSGESGLKLDIQPGGRFIAVNIPLRQFIRAAYTLQLYQIVGAPDWVGSERFDVTATADRDLTVTTPWIPGGKFAVVQLMMQSLLADRFGMVSHMESRDTQAYALVVEKPDTSAGRLRPPTVECGTECGMRARAGVLHGRNVPLPQLAEFLSQQTGRLVTDATGLAGKFDFDLQWAPEQLGAPADAPSIFTAVQEQLGLRLETRRATIPILVIDSIRRPDPD